jgi:hypothetical protein
MLSIRHTGCLKTLNRITYLIRTWKYIDYIQSSTQDQLGIINNILDIPKIKAGELRLESSIKTWHYYPNSISRCLPNSLALRPRIPVACKRPSVLPSKFREDMI